MGASEKRNSKNARPIPIRHTATYDCASAKSQNRTSAQYVYYHVAIISISSNFFNFWANAGFVMKHALVFSPSSTSAPPAPGLVTRYERYRSTKRPKPD